MRLTIRKNKTVQYQIKLYDKNIDDVIFVNGGKSLKEAKKRIFDDFRDTSRYSLIKIDLNVK